LGQAQPGSHLAGPLPSQVETGLGRLKAGSQSGSGPGWVGHIQAHTWLGLSRLGLRLDRVGLKPDLSSVQDLVGSGTARLILAGLLPSQVETGLGRLKAGSQFGSGPGWVGHIQAHTWLGLSRLRLRLDRVGLKPDLSSVQDLVGSGGPSSDLAGAWPKLGPPLESGGPG
jgi:hypothetical protein